MLPWARFLYHPTIANAVRIIHPPVAADHVLGVEQKRLRRPLSSERIRLRASRPKKAAGPPYCMGHVRAAWHVGRRASAYGFTSEITRVDAWSFRVGRMTISTSWPSL